MTALPSLQQQLEALYEQLTAHLSALDRDETLALSEYDRSIHRERRALVSADRATVVDYLDALEQGRPLSPWPPALATIDVPTHRYHESAIPPASPNSRVRITAIYPSQAGATVDWNGRGGVGPDDSFIEVSTSQPVSLGGYTILVGDCEYTIESDNVTYPLKVFWLDLMRTLSGKPCVQFPLSGTAELYDASNNMVDQREYHQPRVDESWAPLDANDPDGPWGSRPASPSERWSTRDIKTQVIAPKRTTFAPSRTPGTPPMVFLSYAREDVEHAKKLRADLMARGVTVWFDKDALLPGEKWPVAIERAIKASRFFMFLLSSNSVTKKGYVQRELRIALDVLDEYPESEVYVIPVRLDSCEPSHSRLHELQWVDLFEDWRAGIDRILLTVHATTGH